MTNNTVYVDVACGADDLDAIIERLRTDTAATEQGNSVGVARAQSTGFR